MEYDNRLSKEETTLCLLISFYKLERTCVFRPIYLQKLFEELRHGNPKKYQMLQKEIGTFNLPMEMYLNKLLKADYLEKRDEINYNITLSERIALKIDKQSSRKETFYEYVRSIKKSLDYFDKAPIEEELGEEYCLIITPEDFLIAFFTKLFSVGVYSFDLDVFEEAFSFSFLDNEAMKKFLEVNFNHSFEMEDMGILMSKVLRIEQDFSQNFFWLGTMEQSKYVSMLSLDNKQVIYEMVKKYLEKKKTIQKGPSVVK